MVALVRALLLLVTMAAILSLAGLWWTGKFRSPWQQMCDARAMVRMRMLAVPEKPEDEAGVVEHAYHLWRLCLLTER
jgi:hypothetical protein